jgi:hypothetical protein
MEMLRRAVIRAVTFGACGAVPGPRLNRQPRDAAKGGCSVMNAAGNLAVVLQSVVYRADRPKIPFFEKIALWNNVQNQPLKIQR